MQSVDYPVEISIGSKGLADAAATLEARIRARFPASSLLANASWLRVLIGLAPGETAAYRRRFALLRMSFVLFSLAAVGLCGFGVYRLNLNYKPDSVVELAQLIESGINDAIFLALGAYFLFRLEPWIKRHRMMVFLGTLRDLVHVTQLLQMNKDPERVVRPRAAATDSDGVAHLDSGKPADAFSNAFLMGRYLDYCLDLLTLISATAAFVGRDISDKPLRDGIWELEELCSSISSKISNKTLMLFNALVEERRASESVSQNAPK
jgi:hypothetical protein